MIAVAIVGIIALVVLGALQVFSIRESIAIAKELAELQRWSDPEVAMAAARRGVLPPDCIRKDPAWQAQAVFFPLIDESVFAPGERTPYPDDPALVLQRFGRRYTLKDNEKLREQGVLKR